MEWINLDDAIQKYVPHLPLTNQWHQTNPVTIRYLPDHTSGFTDARLWHAFSTSARADTHLESVYTNDPGMLHIHTRPGSVYSYSNATLYSHAQIGNRYRSNKV